MAADDTSTWGSLPGIIIVEILSYLTLKDRLNATSTCRRWRTCLWHPSLWQTFTFSLKIGSRTRSKHLADRCGRFVRSAIVELNSTDSCDVTHTAKILDILSQNRNLQSFSLKPSSCHIEWPEGRHIREQINSAIGRIITTPRRLKHFALGNSEDLFLLTENVLDQLSQQHWDTLQSLHISSAKEDPENYRQIDICFEHIQPFKYLRALSLDYDYLTNALLNCLATDRVEFLEKLVINVHGIDCDHEKLLESSWRNVKQACTNLEVTLNFIHSEDGIANLTDILRCNMPLAHFRSYFCSQINTAGIDFMVQQNWNTLKSVEIVDGITNMNQANVYHVVTDEDPFVMMAWKCVNLRQFVLIGYSMLDDNLIAMARLRGKQLDVLDIPLCCLAQHEDDLNRYPDGISHGRVGKDLFHEISTSLGRDWRPIMDTDLHPAVLDVHADAETAYRHILLDDQVWIL